MKQLSLSCLCLIFFNFVQAAVPVEERGIPRASQQSGVISPVAPGSVVVPVAAVQPTPVAATDTYGILQMLRQEVMELRGIVDELSYEVKQLKQRQTDDYLDLDRRIAAPLALAPVLPAVASVTPLPEPDQLAVQNEVEQYSAAYNLLKDGNVAEAKTALQQHTQDFPEGDYTPNAYYWLGEIYLLENQTEKAVQSFEIVVSRYPAHRKAPDARFKLGTAYHLSGDHEKAQQMLNQAASGVGSSANLAAKYLKENY